MPGLPTWAFPERTQLLSQHQPFLGACKPPREHSILQVEDTEAMQGFTQDEPSGEQGIFLILFTKHHPQPPPPSPPVPSPPEKGHWYPDAARGASTSTDHQPCGGAALQHGSHGAGLGFQHLALKPFSQGAFEKRLKAQLPPTSARGPPRCGSGSLALLVLARAAAGLAGKRLMLTGVDSL